MIHPVALKTPDPAYPRSASQNRIGGTATVALTVLPDGSVDNVQLIGSAGKEMDQITQEIVKTWKFKPAMCGNEPVASDIRVDMNFRLR
jgi:protein TonB